MNVFWFRRDLRLSDNAGLYHALKSGQPVMPVFIFDTNILDDLEDRNDARVQFIHQTLYQIHERLIELGSSLIVLHGKPQEVFAKLIEKYQLTAVYANSDYELYAIERDENIRKMLLDSEVEFRSYKDQVIFENREVIKDDDSPYVVYSPYSRKWKSMLTDYHLRSYPTEKYFGSFYKTGPVKFPSLGEIGFKKSDKSFPDRNISEAVVKNYHKQRDYPGEEGTSRLGIHLRFGTISIREAVAAAKKLSDVFLNELIWRDFYQMILANFPNVAAGESFKKEYDRIEWRNNEKEFSLWCEGKTGYQLVDAGMRQLNETGFMHNRVRMVTASFLSKHLLIDWRWGEAYFARKLLDYDFASNNGGWQWAAGTGCDAAPYFRIFNPTMQAKKFDPGLKYIRRWVPEIDSFEYPSPIVDHNFARQRCLAEYSKALREK